MMTHDLTAKAELIYHLLLERYGERPLVPRREPMHELISTMLSHRTTHADEETAYQRMWARFPSWEAIRDAPSADLAHEFRSARFPEPKADNIKASVALIIAERGTANIDFLAHLPIDEAIDWLLKLPGVGIKTATLVLLFCFAQPVLPVDTHVHRISQRTGLIGSKVSAEKAHHLLLELLPSDPYVLFNFHKALLKHGQQLCRYGTPICAPCPLKAHCDWYQTNIATD